MNRSPAFVLLDASCLLNLYATGQLRDIALAQPSRFAVADYVLEQEALFVWHQGSTGEWDEPIAVDLTALIQEGLIQVMRLEHQEQETFVDLAALMDDGEAITGAIAVHRGYGLATDDRKARRVLSQHAPGIPLTSTLELVKRWAAERSITPIELRAALLAMQSGASYIPSERDPLYEWWQTIASRET